MKKHEVKPMEWRPINRLGFMLIGLMLIAVGTRTLLRGMTHYETFWGSAVSAPFAIFIGLLVLVVAFVRWRKGI
jgi:hypothetical protein